MSASMLVGFPSISGGRRSPAGRKGTVAMAAAACPAATKTAGGKALYAVLGVDERASMGEIKAAYRNLAKRWHPDVAGEKCAGIFLQIQQAYAMLTDPSERERYDSSMGNIGLGFRRGGRSCTTKRWETDQCW